MNKIIMIMVDGLGIHPDGSSPASLQRCCLPKFIQLLEQHSTAIDANLGIPGLPQSATGQCSLFCGINAAQAVGRHLSGFPNSRLRELIQQQNIFKSLLQRGAKVTFANAYINHTLASLRRRGLCSVTTVMTDSTLGKVRGKAELLRGDALFHDITREYLTGTMQQRWQTRKTANLPPALKVTDEITPEQAAADLLQIAARHDFTLFEFFMSDRAGHRQNEPFLHHIMHNLSRFVIALSRNMAIDTTLLLTSDHGNCEDLSTKTHTNNPVPLLLYHPAGIKTPSISSLTEVHDLILELIFSAP